MPQVKKGNLGEKIVDEHFEGQGYIIYEPTTNAAHLIDRLYVKDKKQLIFADVKTKAKRNLYPDTGFDYKHYKEYKMLQDMGLEVWIFFVDEVEGGVYGNTLKELSKPCEIQHNGKIIKYPLRWGEIIYFYRNNMEIVRLLTTEEVKEIRGYNTRNYEYEVHS
tara:strand:+ start:305 stop:793 length:489 start_codon:yes stop_codon:yes gene_type:complete